VTWDKVNWFPVIVGICDPCRVLSDPQSSYTCDGTNIPGDGGYVRVSSDGLLPFVVMITLS
jgi:hypothetical protein